MRIFFATQTQSLDLWYQVCRRVRDQVPDTMTGYLVCGRQHYEAFCRSHPEFEESAKALVKEWELVAAIRNRDYDPRTIAHYERRLGNPNLWGPLVGDRRVYLGRKCTYRQDYEPRFNHEQMLAMLQRTLEAFDRAFQELEPEVVVTTYPATFGDYVAYLFGRERGALTLDFRLTRVRNYVVGDESIFEPCEYIRARYERFREAGCPAQLKAEAEAYVSEYLEGRPIYDGMILANGEAAAASEPRRSRSRSVARRMATLTDYWTRGYYRDNHLPNPLEKLLYQRIVNPLRKRLISRKLRKTYLSSDGLEDLDYAFFPLHAEPELTLNVYARPYLNQIEVARLISHSLPVNWKLLVKEHPAVIGRRPRGYYEKLLQIPNLRLIRHDVPARLLVRRAKLVAVITGSVALEALMLQVPAVILGNSPFDYLPATMVRRVRDPHDLPAAIRGVVDSYRYDKNALVNFIAATMDASVPVNLVTDLLGKSGRFRPVGEMLPVPLDRHPHVERLTDYLLQRICEKVPKLDPATHKYSR